MMKRQRRRIYKLVTCAICNHRFRAARKDAKYCSPACRKQASRAGQKNKPKPEAKVTLEYLEALTRLYSVDPIHYS